MRGTTETKQSVVVAQTKTHSEARIGIRIAKVVAANKLLELCSLKKRSLRGLDGCRAECRRRLRRHASGNSQTGKHWSLRTELIVVYLKRTSIVIVAIE